MINGKKIGMIVLNYNDSQTVEEYYHLIKDYRSLDHIVIVDNKSPDGSFEKLKPLAGENIDVIQTDQNKGYSYGNNFGAWYLIDKYHVDILFISNPDVEYSENFLSQVVTDMKKNNAQAATGYMQLPYEEKMTRYVNGYWREVLDCTYFLKRIFPFNGPIVHPNEGIIDVGWLPGSLFAVDAMVYKKIGGLDENVFLYYEEGILGEKFRLAGYKMIINTDISYFHHSSVSISKSMKKYSQLKQSYKSKYYLYTTYENINILKRFIMKACILYGLFRGKIKQYLKLD